MILDVCFQFLTICLAMLEAAHVEDPKTAKTGEFPFMAQIARVVDANSTYSIFSNICGGSLISAKWVLTAGQCFPWSEQEIGEVASNNSMVVIMGSVRNLDFTTGTSRRFLVKIFRHPDFQDIVTGTMESISDDIAVAEMNKEFILNKYIQPVALASPSFLHGVEIIQEVSTCTVMGFGAVERKKNPQANLLTYNEIFLVSSLKYGIPKTANVFISASDPDAVKNHGDIGSPVICMGLQFGVVSALVTIDNAYVDMYTQVEQYEKFIKQHVPEVVFRLPMPNNTKNSGSPTYIQRRIGYLQIFRWVVAIVFCV